jgi:H+/gluconate symporter-like permease
MKLLKITMKKERETMLDIITGILLLLVFVGLVVYCMKGGNLLIGFIATAVLWCVIGRVPINEVVSDVFQKPLDDYGKTIAIIIFGAWFGRILVDTGIAGYIIKKTVEFAGDRPLVTTLLLCITCNLLFTSVFGVGSVMAIGMIVLPILFSMGVEKRAALGAYMLSVAGGMYLNIAYVSQFEKVFGEEVASYNDNYIRFALMATAIHMVIMIAFVVYHHFKNSKRGRRRAWEAGFQESYEERPLGWYCFIVPFVPIAMVGIFKWQPVPAFLLGSFIGLLFTRNLRTYKTAVDKTQKTLYDGVADSGLLIGMLYSVNIFQGAATKVVPYLQTLLGDVVPRSEIVVLVAFCILAPLALFRGPLMIWGSGIALYSILNATGAFNPHFLYAIFLIPPVAIVASACPTQSWTMWGLSYAKVEPKQYIKTNLPWAWASLIAIEILIYFTIGRMV